MGKTKIEWTDRTWNPVMGCSRMSEGCRRCYAMGMMKRFAGKAGWPKDPNVPELFEERLSDPLKWKSPQRVFVCSCADLFHDDVPWEWVSDIYRVMADGGHVYMVLTKRPRNMASFLGSWTPPDFIWHGVSVENENVVHRIDWLRKTKSKVKFVSFEPLIGKIFSVNLEGIQWVIIGCETGAGAKPISLGSVDVILREADRVGARVFVKKISKDKDKQDIGQWPIEWQRREYP